ncbi:MAG: tetratricopeptide repeat protein, partial [Ignavibacteria bacterium]
MLKTGLNLLFVALIVVMIASCGKQEKELKTEEEYLTTAKSLYDSGLVKNDNELFNQSIKKYQEFISKFPNSEKVLFAYNQIAGINFDNLKNYPEAINTYKVVVDKYSDKKEGKQSLFMIAFIYDETMKDKENAKIYYKKFIEKYPTDTDPNDKMTESAKRMLEVLETGKTIEELILQNSGDSKTTETKTDT